MGVKRQFFAIECQQISAEEMVKLENHHLQWMLKPMGENGMKKRKCQHLKVTPFPNTYQSRSSGQHSHPQSWFRMILDTRTQHHFCDLSSQNV